MANFNTKQRRVRRKQCQLCLRGIEQVDYKDAEVLNKFLTQQGKIAPKRITGACTKHQRRISNAIKRARIIAILPFVKL